MTDQSISSLMSPGEALRVKGAAIASSINAIAIANLEGEIIYVNPAFLGMWQCTEADVLGQPVGEFWQQPDDVSSFMDLIEEPGGWHGELAAKRLDGSSFNVQLSVSLVPDNLGRPLCMMGIFLDVSPYRESEEMLRKYMAELNERVKELNLLFRVSGLADEPEVTIPDYLQEVVNILPSGWKHSDDAYAQIAFEEHLFSTENFQPTSWQQQSPIMVAGKETGAVLVGYLSAHPPADEGSFLTEERSLIDELAKVIAGFIERKRVVLALRRSETRYRDLFENSPIALFEQDFSAVKRRIAELQRQGLPMNTRAFFESRPDLVAECISLVEILGFNNASLELYGATDKTELLVGLDRLLPSEAHQMFIDELVWIAEGSTSFIWEGVNRKLCGDLIHIRLHWSAAPGSEDTLERVLVSIEDITAQKQAEIALQVSEARYRAVSELTSDFAYTMRVNPDGSLETEWITDAFTRITGFSAAEVEVPGGWLGFIHPDDRDKAELASKQLLKGKSSVVEVRLRTKPGEIRWVRFHSRPEADRATGQVVRIRGAGQDITEYKRIEEEMIRTERLAAMGQVVATLAHEVKNPLQALNSNLELLSDYPLEPDEREESLRICRDEVQRLIDITQNVLSLSRTDIHAYQPVSIAQAWQQTLDLLKQPIQDAGINVDVDLPPELPKVSGSLDQIVQVLLNLALNSLESMPGGGNMEISGRQTGNQLTICITNDGPPIPNEHVEHLFEPFFTTKPNGTGLGLFVCHAIIQQHGGSLSAGNLPNGSGVRFTIALPVAQESLAL